MCKFECAVCVAVLIFLRWAFGFRPERDLFNHCFYETHWRDETHRRKDRYWHIRKSCLENRMTLIIDVYRRFCFRLDLSLQFEERFLRYVSHVSSVFENINREYQSRVSIDSINRTLESLVSLLSFSLSTSERRFYVCESLFLSLWIWWISKYEYMYDDVQYETLFWIFDDASQNLYSLSLSLSTFTFL